MILEHNRCNGLEGEYLFSGPMHLRRHWAKKCNQIMYFE